MENIEERLQRLEEIVAPNGEEANISDALMAVFNMNAHTLVMLCDHLFDVSSLCESLAHGLSQMIPDHTDEEDSDDGPNLKLVPEDFTTG